MAPRNNSAPVKRHRHRPRHPPAAGPQRATAIVKPGPPIDARRSPRLQAQGAGKPPVSHAPKRPADILTPARTKRKRPQDSEAETDEPKSVHPAKQPRRRFPSPPFELSETNVRLFNGEGMTGSSAPSIKRSSSRRSIAASERSSVSAAHYRYNYLAAADVYIHTDPPDDVQASIKAIVEAKVSTERRTELCAISQELHDGYTKAVRAAVGEDDCVDLFLTALKAMNHSGLCLRAKADWRVELKPTVHQSDLDLNFMEDLNFMSGDRQQEREADDASAPPRKRQQQNACSTYITPRPSRTDASNSTPDDKPLESDTMPPPGPRPFPDKDRDPPSIKTPRPDISIGTQNTALISALSSQNLNNTSAKRFLTQLQNTMMRRERDRPEEPMLISVPTQRTSDLVFAFAAVEGKAYSTGKPVFEAENQAAVSGACGLKMQLCLDELVKGATSSNVLPTLSNTPPPVFFSICTEGPFHELWAHYTDIEDGVRKFNMVLLEICHGMLLKSVVDFFIAVDNVLRWGIGEFLESVVERLGKVARRAGA